MAAVDPGMLKFYKKLCEHSPPESANWPLDRQRQAWDDVCRMFRAPRPERLIVEDLDANGVHVRIFRPPGNAPKPGVIYFHGGGWVLGSCETHDDMCAELADRADVVVVLADYRLAPEHRHPAQLEDSHAVLEWMRSAGRAMGIDPSHIIGAGDSAGGQMTCWPCTFTARPRAAATARTGADLSGARRRHGNAVLHPQRPCAMSHPR